MMTMKALSRQRQSKSFVSAGKGGRRRRRKQPARVPMQIMTTMTMESVPLQRWDLRRQSNLMGKLHQTLLVK
jgi:hypothetical protein